MNEKKIDFWISNNQNVLFTGKHGVGKTAIVKEAFERHKLNYRYFSASTMDPWVDFIGVPKEKRNISSEQLLIVKDLISINHSLAVEWIVSNWGLSDDSANQIVTSVAKESDSYLELIRPLVFATGEIEALFFDEFNRSPKKVRNAVMELLQFKSINGHIFPKLRIIWAAINPDECDGSTYDVEKIDPAQRDRFHVFVNVPYKPNVEWFRANYGEKIANAAVQWWDELENKDEVSPRRLQYALDTYLKKGDMRDVLPASSNVSKLFNALGSGPILERLEKLLVTDNQQESIEFLSNENNFASAIKYIVKSKILSSYFLPLIPKEKIAMLLSQNDSTSSHIISRSSDVSVFRSVCEEVLRANTNSSLSKKIRKHFTESQLVAEEPNEKKFCKVFYNKEASTSLWKTLLKELNELDFKKDRLKIMQEINHFVPKCMDEQDAVLCLEIISGIDPTPTEIAEGMYGHNLVWSNLLGIINHLICEGVRNLPSPSLAIFKQNNTSVLSKLYVSIKLGGFEKDVIKSEEQLDGVL